MHEKLSERYFVIRIYHYRHNCTPGHLNIGRAHGSEWVCAKITEKIKQSHNYRPNEKVHDIRREYGVTISYEVVWLARELCREKIHGSLYSSYALLSGFLNNFADKNGGVLAVHEAKDEHFSAVL